MIRALSTGADNSPAAVPDTANWLTNSPGGRLGTICDSCSESALTVKAAFRGFIESAVASRLACPAPTVKLAGSTTNCLGVRWTVAFKSEIAGN